MIMTLLADPQAMIDASTERLRSDTADVDERRAISPAVTATLKEAGVFRMLAPRSIGGLECDPLAFFDVVESASYADGSVGWCTLLGGCYAAFGGMLPSAGASEIFGDPDTIAAGAFNPNAGVAVEVEGGYRVSGHWSLGSGSCHANWYIGGGVILRNGAPVMQANGVPMMREFFFPASVVSIIDTWDSTGLRGTASHDYSVDNVFVPAKHTVWFQEPPVEDGPLYRMPPIAMFATFIGAMPLGAARHALDAFIELAANKVPVLSQSVLADKQVAQATLGQAATSVDAARVYLRATLADVWQKVQGGGAPTLADRGRLWTASTYAGHTALAAAEALYTAAGASAVYRRSPLDRCVRDIRTAVQHVCLQLQNYELTGRHTLGRDALASVWGMDYRGEG